MREIGRGAFVVERRGDRAGSSLEAILTTLSKYGEIKRPDECDPPILTSPVRKALSDWLAEMRSRDELEAVGLKPRHRCLLYGPPGCGKTTLAHHIAAREGMPLLVVQSNSLIDKYIGSTGRNLGELFKSLRQVHDVVAVFFDECDALFHARKSDTSTGGATEQNSYVIALLQELDRYEGMFFAATNMSSSIDPAIWRRFEMQIELPLPGPDETFSILKRYLSPLDVHDETIDAFAASMQDASPALIRQACEHVRRSLALAEKWNSSTALPDILARFIVSVTPSDGMPTPPLWLNFEKYSALLAKSPWPPAVR